MKTFNRAILGHRMASAFLLNGFALCSFGAQADVLYSKHGEWTVAYLEVGNLNGCRATRQFPDQTAFQMVQIQSGTDKAWVIFISNPRWNAWIGNRKEIRLSLVTDWPTTKPWPYTFSTSGESKILSTTDASVEFMNSVADASKVEIKDDKGALLAAIDMKDSAAAIRAVVTCVREHPPKREPETTISGTGFFVAPNRVLTNNHVVSGCTKDIQVRYPNRRAYTATISGQDATNDLVLLYTDMDNLSIAAFFGDQVASYGFPRSDILSSSGNCTVGNVTSLIGPKDDTRFLQMSAPIQPGNSGGALLDMSGSVVGVVVGQLSVLQNVNFAIQPSMVINFLEVKDVNPKLDTPKAPRSPTEVCEIATKFTIQVYCQGRTPPKTATGTAGPLALSPSDVADFGTRP